MIINCPKCKTELDLPDEAVTFKVECDCCGEKFEARNAVFNKGMEACSAAERDQACGQTKDAMANWATAHFYFKAASDAGHSDAFFMSGIAEVAESQKFHDEVRDAPQNAKSAVALLFWYWKNAKTLDAATRQRYEAFRSSFETRLDEESLNFLIAEYEGMNSTVDVERLKGIAEKRRSAVAKEAAQDDPVAQYVLPDGALHDRPKSAGQVMEDNPILMTDGFVSRTLTCSGCGKPFKVAYRKLVNLTDNDTVKYAIKDGTYFKFTCPHCKKPAPFGFRMSVHDVMKRYFIRSFDNLQSMLSVHMNRSTLKGSQWGFPDEFLPLVRHRLVLGTYGLIEKVSIFEAGLDDYTVEGLKQVIANNQENGLVAKDIYFDRYEDGKLIFHVFLADGRQAMSQVSKNMYDNLKGGFDKTGKFTEGVFRWVDRQTMTGQFADMDNWWAPDEAPKKPVQPQPKQENRPLRAGDVYTLRLGNGVEMRFRWCPPGSFSMGDTFGVGWGIKPRMVTLTRGFWIAETPVTKAQYKAVMAKSYPAGQDNLPMTNMPWADCVKFCNGFTTLLGANYKMDLPTEAQWEYAARAGTTGDYGTNYRASQDADKDAPILGQLAWTASNSGNEAHPIGQKKPNAWGIYDMLGNVYEYVKDTYTDNKKRLEESTVDPCIMNVRRNSSAIMRGGCYYKDWLSCSVWERREVHKEGIYHIGFRTVIVPR